MLPLIITLACAMGRGDRVVDRGPACFQDSQRQSRDVVALRVACGFQTTPVPPLSPGRSTTCLPSPRRCWSRAEIQVIVPVPGGD